jgi:hypothetical protein
VLWFFGIAYGLSWAWCIPIALDHGKVHRGDGSPTHAPGLLRPMLAAFVVLAVTEGRGGVGELLSVRRARWCSPRSSTGTGGSVLAVALWHALYNLAAATAAAEGAVAAVVTACVIFWGVSLVERERAGIPALDIDAIAGDATA